VQKQLVETSRRTPHFHVTYLSCVIKYDKRSSEYSISKYINPSSLIKKLGILCTSSFDPDKLGT